MFKGIRTNPKRQSSQDVVRNPSTTPNFIDALGSSGAGRALGSPTESPAFSPYGHSNKENRPTVRAELFVNVPHPVGSAPRRPAQSSSEEESRPSRLLPATPTNPRSDANKRSSVVLPPSANLAANNNYSTPGSNYSTTRGDMAPPPPRRSATAGVGGGYESDPGRSGHSRGMSTPGIALGSGKGWGFEFLDHPPPTNAEDVEKEPLSTHAEFNKMLDDLQIPSTLRPKLQGLDTPVKAAMLRSSQVLTIPPPGSSPMLPSASSPSSPTKSKFGKGTQKDKKSKDSNKYKTENFGREDADKRAPNPFMFNRNGGGSGKTTPKKGGIRRAQSSGSLDGSPNRPLGTPYTQMPVGTPNGSAYNLALGAGQEQALQFMFPSLDDEDGELVPPPTLAQLQGGFVPPVPGQGHVRGSSFDSGMNKSELNLSGMNKSGTKSTVYLNGTGTGSSWGVGTSNGSVSAGGSVGMSHGNASRPRVGSGPRGEAILVKDRVASKEKEKYNTVKDRDWTAARFSAMLAQTKSVDLEVERLKKLRIMLRNEAASWSESFLIEGGYSALLERLTEVLQLEWREEQRDDQILHEILRCFKALSTSSIGQFALRSSAPRPFVQLVSLLYSDKKPGDACSRILIVELLIILTELYPSDEASSIPERPSSALGLTTTPPRTTLSFPKSQYPIPAPHNSLFSLMRAVLLTPKPLPTECPSLPVSPHAFIESLHHARIYKAYLGEVSDVVRDYFWVFCHPGNGIWDMEAVDVEKVEAPRAPGGMTGGVEFEAMNYLTTHFKLLNAIGRAAADLQLPPENELSAAKYHHDLFMSGIEKIIAGSRKASSVYYPGLHLEIARYIQLVREAGMELPYGLQRMVGPPPANLCKPGYEPVQAPSSSTKTPTKHSRGASAAPALVTAVGGGGSQISPVKPGYQGRPAGAGQGPPILPAPKF